MSQTIGLLYPNGLLQPLKNSQGLATNNGTGVSFHIDDRQIQEFHQYSVETQYQLPWRSVVTMGYVGSRTTRQPITVQLNDLTPQQLALGDTFLNELVPNPFAGLLPGSSFNGQSGNNATIQRRQLLRPYPQFDGVQKQLIPEGRLWYHSLPGAVGEAAEPGRVDARELHVLAQLGGSRSAQRRRGALQAAEQQRSPERAAAQRHLDDAEVRGA